MKRGSASFEQWVDRAIDPQDEEPTDAELDGAVTDPYDANSYDERADQERKGDWK